MAEPTPTPIGLVVKLPYDSPEDFLARYGANLTFGGIYLRSKSVKPPGTPVTLDLQLTTGTRLLYTSAIVHFVTGQAGQGLSGMGLRFLAMDVASREFLERAAASAPHLASPHPPVPPNVGTPDYTVPAELAAEQPAPAEAPSPAAPEALGRLPELPYEEPQRTGTIIGIDLGTTNSCVAAMRSGRPALLLSREGHRTVPSIVALNSRNKLVVGHPAKGQMLTNPRQTVYGSKRLIGRSYDSPFVQQIKDRFSYEIAPGAHGEAAVRLGDRMYSLQQISALILREVKEVAQNQLGEPISRAVITVPAYYNDNQRQAVREAGRLAGLYVERIVNEPTAAALAYGYGRRLHQRVLVYDLGGGTFDASVLQLKDNLYEVLSTGGDTFLGGIDFDNAIVEHLLEHFQRATGRPFQGDRVALQRLHDAAERAKCSLSEITQARVYVPFLTLVEDKPYDLDVTLTRDTLVSLTERLVDRTLEVCQQVLAAKGLTVQDLDEVLLVGGQSRFPLVHEKVTTFFGKPPSKSVHPDEAVAMGAALLAHSLGASEGVTLVDVLPMSIGVGLPGGRFKPVLEHNVRLPVAKTYRIATTRDDQAYVEMSVYQGDSERTPDNEYLGTLKLEGLPPGPRGSVKVGITFEVDTECTLRVTARELSTGAEVSSTFAMRRTATEAAGGKAVLEQTVHSYRLPGSSPSSTSIPAVGGRTPPVLNPAESSAEVPAARRPTGSFAAVPPANAPGPGAAGQRPSGSYPAAKEPGAEQQGSKRITGWFKRILDE